ncbi:DUF2207 domain-containing protein [Peptoniphilus sp. MSJ-1]|uniref:DUF2207 domain-containing protein n=1 Tax=Peptoniphilus ovalis TaxID=2841503 RepID=A0ABS6FGL4_9FIRM|nr:DUF2207 domain-containing protein [Peptoniphilus ovalis]MBU5668401.1 DUF2207 domain-containing protein [Peptoniphilus ovalis]
MKNKILALVTIFIFVPSFVFAEEFKSINIDAKIDKNGVGHITETWKIHEDNDNYTERYKTINNLQGIKIEDFSLNALGRDFTELSPWDIDASFDDKKYRYGRIDKGDEIELTWGISEYSDNTYNLNYKINPLVVGLNDSDMLFFNFVGDNFDPEPKNISIKISGFEPFKDVKMWGFGLQGEIHNVNGDILLNSTGDVNYATIMLKFPKGYFNTAMKIDKNFDDYAKEASIGSDWQDREGEAYKPPMSTGEKIAVVGGLAGFSLILFFIVGAFYLTFREKNIQNKSILPGKKKFKNNYLKEVPYDGNIEDIAFFIKEANLVYTDLVGNYINSFILKWLLSNNIEFIEDSGIFAENKIKILSRPNDMGKMEEELFEMLSAANEKTDSEYLTSKDFEKYVKKNKDDMENYYEKFEDESIKALEYGGYLEDYEFEKKFFGFKNTGKELKITDKGIKLYGDIIKFYNYLDDYYELVEDEKLPNWENLLIYSSVFFLDKEFAKGAENYNSSFNPALYVNLTSNSRDFSKSINQSYGSATGFSNAGFGGATSAGGGGGSFGGGGGGGR